MLTLVRRILFFTRSHRGASGLWLAIALVLSSGAPVAAGSDAGRAQVDGEERVRVLVRVRSPGLPRALLGGRVTSRDRARIAAAQARLVEEMAAEDFRVRRAYRTIPYVALEVGAAGLERLRRSRAAIDVREDHPHAAGLAEAVPAIGAPFVWAAGFDGSGQSIAILDTGVDANHPMLAGRVIAEACFSGSRDCPNGKRFDAGPGAARPCDFDSRGCRHGTHVAGIAAGRDAELTGVAPGASLVAIQVFSRNDDCAEGESVPCPRTWTSDYLAGLQWVLENHEQLAIAAVNLSFSRGAFDSHEACDADALPVEMMVEQLRAAGVAVVAAAGNGGESNALGSPACLSSMISVGAIDDHGAIASFSDRAPFLTLFAPGVGITSAAPDGLHRTSSGTSMAAPHVAGAFALLRQHDPGAPLDAILAALVNTGSPVPSPEGGFSIPRLELAPALESRSGLCPCLAGKDDFCLYAPGLCEMTAPGGYCDPNGDGDFSDADWVRGYEELRAACSSPERRSSWSSAPRGGALGRQILHETRAPAERHSRQGNGQERRQSMSSTAKVASS